MCGIYGQFSPRKAAMPHETALALTQKLNNLARRRGPDDEGYWHHENHCYFGFRRLSILDPSPSGQQPMCSPDGRYCLVYNGEVYNFAEIRSRLNKEGVKLRSTGDTEVVLHALARWGTQALPMFNGMFALGFYDRKDRSLLLARDPAGIKPLYVMTHKDGIAFASEFPQMLQHPWGRGDAVSAPGLSLYLRFGFVPSPHSLLDHCSMMEAGAAWLFDSNLKPLKRKYFEFPRSFTSDLKGAAAWEAVNDAVGRSVKRQMVSDVPIGSFLSGGIDSPLVTAAMCDGDGKPCSAFTVCSEDPELDESGEASQYAKALQCTHTLRRFNEQQVIAYLEQAVEACGEPLADESILPALMVSGLAAEQVKVALSGDGGDELFWGYPERFGSVIEKAGDFAQPEWRRNLRWAMKKHLNLGNGYWNLRLDNIGQWYQLKHTYVSEEWQARILPGCSPQTGHAENVSLSNNSPLFAFSGHDPDETAQWLRWNEFTCHLQRVLLKMDRASMYHSLEVRVPLLDLELIQIAGRIDWKSCLDVTNNMGKLPLRKALEQRVDFQSRKKKGFSVPMTAWLRGPLRETGEDLISNTKDILGFPVHHKELKNIWNAHQSGAGDYSRMLWNLFSLMLWEKKHYK